MPDTAKFGARHSAKDVEILHNIRLKAREIDQHAVDLGAQTDEEVQVLPESPAKADVAITDKTPMIWGVVKAAGDWTLDVLGVPYGDASSKDSDGEWFDSATRLHEDKFPLPPIVYYHGFGPDKQPLGAPEYIGKTVKRWRDAAGEWFRVVLDKTSEFAKRVWDAAQEGVARASSGSISHLTRKDESGHIREWPVVEVSVFDAVDGREPANRYAVAIPTAKAMYALAGLDTSVITSEAEPEAEQSAATATASQNSTIKTDKSEGTIMDEKQVQEAIAAALKARDDEAKVKAEADAVTALKAENEALKAAAAVVNRLPGGGAPAQRKFGYTAKYDHLDVAQHALLIDILNGPHNGMPKNLASDEALKALALKCESEASKNTHAADAFNSLKAMGLKADELNRSTLASYGDEWVGVLYGRTLWESIRAECWVLQKLEPFADTIPDGYESDSVPMEGADPTWYHVPQAADATNGRPDVTITASKIGTVGPRTVTVAKMGCRVMYTGEMQEDSLIPWVPNAMRQMKASGLEQFEHAVIDGDTDLTINTNINDIAGTPANTEVFTLVNGFRKLALVTNTANSRAGGALADEDFLDTALLLGAAGIYADQTKVTLIPDSNTYWKAVKLSTVKTPDVWQQATMVNGDLTKLWGFEIKKSAFMHYVSANRKANTAGKIDQDVTANNTTGSILAVRWDQWRLKWKRRMTVETSRWPESDTNQIVAMARWGLGYHDTEASAITYGITGV